MHPYESLGENYFWATAVAKRNMFDINGLWDPRFPIDRSMKVSTYGSCFAQHIGRALKGRGFNWFIAEQAPKVLSPENAQRFNYGVFSARTGNIYTVSLLKQWLDWASDSAAVPTEVWSRDGRFFDPFRPNIEPDGFESPEEVTRSRRAAIAAFLETITESDILVFTLGLTESWVNRRDGYEYPMCPGTVAGDFDGERHGFVNQDTAIVRKTLVETLQRIRRLNPRIKVLLTVSPVPLTATMSGNHVLVATMESKSVLRAVAGSVKRQLDFVDYFPSYEIINATPFRGTFFEANQRNVNRAGVDHVMNSFFRCLDAKYPIGDDPITAQGAAEGQGRADGKKAGAMGRGTRPGRPAVAARSNEVCEEELLGAFAKPRDGADE